MLALRAASPSFGVPEAERLARDLYGLAVDASSLPGERDSNFKVRVSGGSSPHDPHEFVLKVLDVTADPPAIDCQARVLRHCADQDPMLPVPHVFATLSGEDVGRFERSGRAFATCLLKFLPGRPLAHVNPVDAHDLLPAFGGTLARLDHALQGFMHPALLRPLAWDVRRLPQLAEHFALLDSRLLRARVIETAEAIKTRLPALGALRSQAIHADCHGGNVLVDAAGAVSGIIDFGDMVHAPMIQELAVSMAELLMDGVAVIPDLPGMIDGYARQRTLEAAEIALLYDLITARQATTLVLHAWRRRHDPAGAELLERGAGRARELLEEFARIGRGVLSERWQQAAAGTGIAAAPVDLERRRRLLGGGAELFYDRPLHLIRGDGVWLYDAAGEAYLDVYNNVPHVGHAHPHVVAAIRRQTGILATHTRYLHGGILDYAERLTARLPPHLNTCLFVNSGSEANDVAWRLAQFATGRDGALIMEHAYHGITAAVTALTPAAGTVSDPRVAALSTPPSQWRAQETVAAVEIDASLAGLDGSIAALTARGSAPAAFFLDSAMTSSGVFDPPAAWGTVLASRLAAAGVLVVADEVQYGLGRSGSHCWGFQRRGLTPDIVTLGKPVANGYPMGVVVAERSLVEAFQKRFGFFSTFGGNAVAASAANAVLDVLEREDLMGNASRTGMYLRERLEALAEQLPHTYGAVRGAGLLVGVEVVGGGPTRAAARAREIINVLARQNRVLAGTEGPHGALLKLRPPMPFGRDHVDRLVLALGEAAPQLARLD